MIELTSCISVRFAPKPTGGYYNQLFHSTGTIIRLNTLSPYAKMAEGAGIGLEEDIAAFEAYKAGSRPDIENWSDVTVLVGLNLDPDAIRNLRYIVNFQVSLGARVLAALSGYPIVANIRTIGHPKMLDLEPNHHGIPKGNPPASSRILVLLTGASPVT